MSLCLCVKMILGVKPLILKWVAPTGSSLCKSNSFFTWQVLQKVKSEMTHWATFVHLGIFKLLCLLLLTNSVFAEIFQSVSGGQLVLLLPLSTQWDVWVCIWFIPMTQRNHIYMYFLPFSCFLVPLTSLLVVIHVLQWNSVWPFKKFCQKIM